VCELGGDDPFTLGEFTDAVSQAIGRPGSHRYLPVEEYIQVLMQAGPRVYAGTGRRQPRSCLR